MPWLKVVVQAAASEVDPLSDLLIAEGAVAVSTRSADAAPIFELAPGEQPLGSVNELEGLFDLGGNLETELARLRASITDRPITVDFLEDVDWQNQWRAFAADEVFGERLWVVDRDAATDDFAGKVLRIEPGLAFGSGAHPTTRLCLDWLANHNLSDQRVLDFGCGSGVLAIAAKLLGAKIVVAVDHDPQALTATRDNAQINGLADDALVVQTNSDFDSGGRFDVVVANILANPLIDLAPLLGGCVAEGGKLIMTGLLDDQASDVMHAYPQFRFEKVLDGEWARLSGGKRA
jgi:ribosomal protein L11 methyltransferase